MTLVTTHSPIPRPNSKEKEKVGLGRGLGMHKTRSDYPECAVLYKSHNVIGCTEIGVG